MNIIIYNDMKYIIVRGASNGTTVQNNKQKTQKNKTKNGSLQNKCRINIHIGMMTY